MPDGVNYLLRVFWKNSKLCYNNATQNLVWLASFLKKKKKVTHFWYLFL